MEVQTLLQTRNTRKGELEMRIRWLAGIVVAGVAAFAIASPAHAGVLVSSATSCDDQVFEQPFLQWADPANYVLAPSGTFEAGSGSWDLAGGAAVGTGDEPYDVHGPNETIGLGLPAGSVATTGSMCVGIEHPTLRLFARNSGSVLSVLKVEVLFEDASGNTHALPIGLLTAGGQWQPTIVMPIVANLLPLLPGERTAVAFRFSANGGNWRIDDVYVDPYRSR
jgi:hypothetical protein